MSETCNDCRIEIKEIWHCEYGKARCFTCHESYSRRLFFARQNEEMRNRPDPYSQMGGACFFCNIPVIHGLFRDISRDGNSETCKTWICWPCHNSRPTLETWVSQNIKESE